MGDDELAKSKELLNVYSLLLREWQEKATRYARKAENADAKFKALLSAFIMYIREHEKI